LKIGVKFLATNFRLMNEYYNPVRESFKLAKKIDSISFWLLLASALLTVINFFLNQNKNYVEYALIVNNVNTLLIIIYAITKFAINYIVFHTSFDKRSDFIDNSFGTNYSSNKSNKYYNNNIESGILRMGANSFESCFFTYHLSLKSLTYKWLFNLITTAIIIGLAVQGYSSVLTMVLQLSLPIFLISDAINHSIFCLRMKYILDSFCRLYNDLLDETQNKNKEPEVILTVLNYETTLSTFNLLISEKIYNENNQAFSAKWNKLKEQYKI
jgi:hypothetical protein